MNLKFNFPLFLVCCSCALFCHNFPSFHKQPCFKQVVKSKKVGISHAVDGVSVNYYGQPFSHSNRNILLNIKMDGLTYDYFNIICHEPGTPEENKKEFLAHFIGDAETIFGEWEPVRAELIRILKDEAFIFDQPELYFFNLLKTYLSSDTGWAQFYTIFTGSYTENNIYPHHNDYSPHDNQLTWRQEGTIFQVPIKHIISGWIVDPSWLRIFPQIDDVKALRFYYMDSYYVAAHKIWKAKTPFIRFDMTDGQNVLLWQNWTSLQQALNQAMDLPSHLLVFPKLIKFLEADRDKDIKNREVLITLCFSRFATPKIYVLLPLEVEGIFN